MHKLTKTALFLASLSLLATACSNQGVSPSASASTGESEAAGGTCLAGAPSVEEMKIKDGFFIASSLDFEPFEFIKDGQPTGFDMELIRAIAKTLCAPEPQITNIGFDTILPQIQSGQQTAAISGITITEERKGTVDFSKPYFDADQSLLVANDSSIARLEDLTADLRVGVAAGTTGEKWAKENVTQASVQSFPTTGAAFQALQAGQIDAVINDKTVTNEQMQLGNGRVVKTIKTGESYGIAVQKGNTALVKGLDMAIDELKANGEYDKIYSKYFKALPGESTSE